MKYLTILTLTTLLSTAYCSYKLLAVHSKGSSEICLSNLASLSALKRYWVDLDQEISAGDKHCSLGSSGMSFSTNKTIMSLIAEVQNSPSELALYCTTIDSADSIGLSFDGLSDNFNKAKILNCKDPSKSLGDIEGSGNKNLNMISDQIRGYRERIAEMEERLISETKLLEAEREIRNMELNDHSDRYYSNDVKLRAHEEIINKRDMTISKQSGIIMSLQKNLTETMRLLNNIATHKPKLTTVLPVITAISLLSSSMAELPIPTHAKNRLGSGSFKISEDDEEGCRPLSYGVNCPAFDLMLRSDHYPFFRAHYSHRSILEAMNDKLITKDKNAVCTLNDSKNADCYDDKSFIKTMCPNGFNSAHYLDNKGKFRAIKCENSHELTEDCTHCRKMKSNVAKPIHKSSLSLQDAVCQPNSDQYNGPSILLKGVCSVGNKKIKRCESGVSKTESMAFVVFSGKGKLYLDNLMLRNLEVISKESFICYDREGQQDGQSKNEVETRKLKRFDVSECKNVDETKSKHCAGDEVFCTKFSCTGSYPVAQCIVAQGSGPIEVNINGVWLKPLCVGFEKVVVRREIRRPIITRQSECVNCIYECRNKDIILRSTGFRMISAVACSHGSCISITQSPSTDIHIPYPGMSASSGDPIGVHMSHDDSSVSSRITLKCPPVDQCVAHSCNFCFEALLNYQCHSIISGFSVFFILALMLFILCLILVWFLKLFRVSPKILRKPFSWSHALLKWVVMKGVLCVSTRLQNLNDEIGWNGEVVVQRPQIAPRRLTRFTYTIGILFLILSVASGCSEFAVASSKMTKCVSKESKINCRVSGSVLLKAGVIGSETCLLIKGHTDSQKTLISVKTVSSEIVCREGQSFWTGQFTPKCVSSRRCHGVGECYDDLCQSWNDNKTSIEFSGVSKNEKMSENKCLEQCGGIGCGCFNINPSCLFVHCELQSTRKEAIRVFSCVDWVHKLTLLVTDSQGSSEKVSLSSMGTKFFKWGSLTLSLDAEVISGSNSLLFMQNGEGGFSIADEQFSDIPREGYIGEVRCSSEAAVISAHSSCKRAPNLIKYKPIMDMAECTTNLVDPFTMFIKGSLPQTRNGKTFTSTTDQKSVQALANAQISAQISLNLDDYDVEFKEDSVSCESTFLNISGCYSCDLGARVCVRVVTSDQGVFTCHNEDNSLILAFHVSSSAKEYCQIVHYNSPHVEESMMYSCGGEERPMVIKGSLIAMMPYDFRNSTGGQSTVVNPRSGGWSFKGWASGFMNWIGGPIKTILLILLYICLSIVGILLLIWLIKKFTIIGISSILNRKRK
ncbi:polyprotein [Uriurana virus]|uniref:Envelopment polyprotein n=1 Tax=Uriurana virus TaxID=1055750 RepID=I1T372_9VIRU|nr:polyprotein [Uriurana virus]YP_010839705.1 glycoprotein [Uriurana virus]AEL29689.1 glycoprotein [Uriurana virus]API68897.1 polyprotein [Uriurana virus]